MAKQDLPEYIYHYTPMEGFRRIIESGCLWLTDIRYLNDPTERKHGYAVVKDYVRQQRKRKYVSVNNRADIPIYTASFSKDGDSLSQWRAYTKGGGVAIGFPSKMLRDNTNHNMGAMLVSCVYPTNLSEFVEIMDSNEIELCCPDFILSDAVKGNSQLSDNEQSILDHFAALVSPKIKHPAFRDENEVRIVACPQSHTILNDFENIVGRFPHSSPQVAFRSFDGLLKPYITFILNKKNGGILSHIKVIVGPNARQELAIESVRQYLEAALSESMFDAVNNVRKSDVPYREI